MVRLACNPGTWRKVQEGEGESILTLKQSDTLGIMLGERKERHKLSEHLIQMPPKPISWGGRSVQEHLLPYVQRNGPWLLLKHAWNGKHAWSLRNDLAIRLVVVQQDCLRGDNVVQGMLGCEGLSSHQYGFPLWVEGVCVDAFCLGANGNVWLGCAAVHWNSTGRKITSVQMYRKFWHRSGTVLFFFYFSHWPLVSTVNIPNIQIFYYSTNAARWTRNSLFCRVYKGFLVLL